MKVSLDSTYFLPIYNVSVSVPNDCLEQISKRSHSFFYSEFVYFECNAKASKYGCNNHNEITGELINDAFWKELASNKYPIWDLACFLKQHHKDFMDCLHYAASVVSDMDIFLSQDGKLKETIDNIKKELERIFPHYKLVRILTYSQYIKEFQIKE